MKYLVLLIAAVAAPLYGQGFYTTYQLDGTDLLQTDAIGYPGGGSCPSMSIYNQLNGNYQTGEAPGDIMSWTYGTDGVGYPWNYGYSFEYMSPYGYCVASTVAFIQVLGWGNTTSRQRSWPPALVSDASGSCIQVTDNLSCTNTSKPRYPVGSVKVGATYGIICSPYYDTLVWNLFGFLEFGPAQPLYGPGYCTPQ